MKTGALQVMFNSRQYTHRDEPNHKRLSCHKPHNYTKSSQHSSRTSQVASSHSQTNMSFKPSQNASHSGSNCTKLQSGHNSSKSDQNVPKKPDRNNLNFSWKSCFNSKDGPGTSRKSDTNTGNSKSGYNTSNRHNQNYVNSKYGRSHPNQNIANNCPSTSHKNFNQDTSARSQIFEKKVKENHSETEQNQVSQKEISRKRKCHSETDNTIKKLKINIQAKANVNTADDIEDIIYKCNQCTLHFMTTDVITKHITLCNGEKPAVIACESCNLQFHLSQIDAHIERDHPKIVPENKNRKFKVIDVSLAQNHTNKTKVTIYKCKVCKIHFAKALWLREHLSRKNHNNNKYMCNTCKLGMCRKTFKIHLEIHHGKMKLNRKDFSVTTNYDERSDNESSRNEESDLDTEEDKESVATPNTENKENDKDKQTVITESEVEKKNDSTSSKDIDTGTPQDTNLFANTKRSEKIDLYQCKICSITYVNERTLLKHISLENHSADVKIECMYCGFLFEHSLLKKHEKQHHEILKLGLGDFNIMMYDQNGSRILTSNNLKRPTKKNVTFANSVASPPKSIKINGQRRSSETDIQRLKDLTRNSLEEDRILYRCAVCDIHYTMQRSLQMHMTGNKHDLKTKEVCDECGLIFTISTITDHKKVHHDVLNLNRDEFIIKSFDRNKQEIRDKETDNVKNQRKEPSSRNFVERASQTDISGGITNREIGERASTEKQDKNTSNFKGLKRQTKIKILPIKRKRCDEPTNNDSAFTTGIRLYKCSDCEIYFLTQKACSKHVINRQRLGRWEYMKCPDCGLSFENKSLIKHRLEHHAKDFNLNDILVTEVQICDGQELNYDTYYYKDRLESNRNLCIEHVATNTVKINEGDGENTVTPGPSALTTENSNSRNNKICNKSNNATISFKDTNDKAKLDDSNQNKNVIIDTPNVFSYGNEEIANFNQNLNPDTVLNNSKTLNISDRVIERRESSDVLHVTNATKNPKSKSLPEVRNEPENISDDITLESTETSREAPGANWYKSVQITVIDSATTLNETTNKDASNEDITHEHNDFEANDEDIQTLNDDNEQTSESKKTQAEDDCASDAETVVLDILGDIEECEMETQTIENNSQNFTDTQNSIDDNRSFEFEKNGSRSKFPFIFEDSIESSTSSTESNIKDHESETIAEVHQMEEHNNQEPCENGNNVETSEFRAKKNNLQKHKKTNTDHKNQQNPSELELLNESIECSSSYASRITLNVSSGMSTPLKSFGNTNANIEVATNNKDTTEFESIEKIVEYMESNELTSNVNEDHEKEKNGSESHTGEPSAEKQMLIDSSVVSMPDNLSLDEIDKNICTTTNTNNALKVTTDEDSEHISPNLLITDNVPNTKSRTERKATESEINSNENNSKLRVVINNEHMKAGDTEHQNSTLTLPGSSTNHKLPNIVSRFFSTATKDNNVRNTEKIVEKIKNITINKHGELRCINSSTEKQNESSTEKQSDGINENVTPENQKTHNWKATIAVEHIEIECDTNIQENTEISISTNFTPSQESNNSYCAPSESVDNTEDCQEDTHDNNLFAEVIPQNPHDEVSEKENSSDIDIHEQATQFLPIQESNDISPGNPSNENYINQKDHNKQSMSSEQDINSKTCTSTDLTENYEEPKENEDVSSNCSENDIIVIKHQTTDTNNITEKNNVTNTEIITENPNVSLKIHDESMPKNNELNHNDAAQIQNGVNKGTDDTNIDEENDLIVIGEAPDIIIDISDEQSDKENSAENSNENRTNENVKNNKQDYISLDSDEDVDVKYIKTECTRQDKIKKQRILDDYFKKDVNELTKILKGKSDDASVSDANTEKTPVFIDLLDSDDD